MESDSYKPTPDRILLFLPTWVGDCVMATPTFFAIRNRYPSAIITALTMPLLQSLIHDEPWQNEILTWPPKKHWPKLPALIRQLRRRKFDLAILFQNSFRSALIAGLAGCKQRIGYDRDGRGFLLTHKIPVPKTAGQIKPHPICDYYAQLAIATGCDHPGDQLTLTTNPNDDETINQRLRDLNIPTDQPKIIISPGASFGASKLWVPERFAQLADRLATEHNAATLITCAPSEDTIANDIARKMTTPAHVINNPHINLSQLKSIVRQANLLVCTDSGTRHIGKAFNIPIVTIFGPTHQEWTDTNYARERKASIPVDCGPCQQKTCPEGHHKCMTDLTVDMVHVQCEDLLSNCNATPRGRREPTNVAPPLVGGENAGTDSKAE